MFTSLRSQKVFVLTDRTIGIFVAPTNNKSAKAISPGSNKAPRQGPTQARILKPRTRVINREIRLNSSLSKISKTGKDQAPKEVNTGVEVSPEEVAEVAKATLAVEGKANSDYPSQKEHSTGLIKSTSCALSQVQIDYVLNEAPVADDHIPYCNRPRFGYLVWEKLGIDPWILSIIKDGYAIEFDSHPQLTSIPDPSYVNPLKQRARLQVLEKLINIGAIEEVCRPATLGYYSHFFVVPKQAPGEWRGILDLSRLNLLVRRQKFKMESAETIRTALQDSIWATSIDLASAYYHVPIHKAHRKLLRFMVGYKIFQFRALPMGLKSAPWVFTRVIRPIKELAHLRKISLHQYLDDWVIRSRSREQLVKDTQFVVNLTQALGFVINWGKSEIIPATKFQFLGMSYNLKDQLVGVSLDRWDRLQEKLRLVLRTQEPQAGHWEKLIATMRSMSTLIPLGTVRTRPAQWFLKQRWHPLFQDRSETIQTNSEIRESLMWWTRKENVLLNPVPLVQAPPTIQLFTDASMVGWGATMELDKKYRWKGVWSPIERKMHINILEMIAVENAVMQNVHLFQGKSVMIVSDNMSVVMYINKQGGIRSKTLSDRAIHFLRWAQTFKISLKARHIAGKLNWEADWLSRDGQIISTEWSLHPEVFQWICQIGEKPMVDLFATTLNKKLPTFVSPMMEKDAWAVDAFSINWTGLHAYAYPPTALITKVLQKIRQEPCKVLLVAPYWPSQPWFTDLLELTQGEPIKLPEKSTLLRQPMSSIFHNNPGVLNLHAWRLLSLN